MKLYLFCSKCKRKIYLASTAQTRYQLSQQWGYNFSLICPNCSCNCIYSVHQVFAESSSQKSTFPIAVIGGLIGLLGGTPGALIGSTVGGIIGKSADNTEENRVLIFNQSR